MTTSNSISLDDIARIYKDFTENGGLRGGFTFTSPQQAFQYDSLYTQSGLNQKAMLEHYLPKMLQSSIKNRVAAISEAGGIDAAGKNSLVRIATSHPGVVSNIIGHAGGEEAATRILTMANGMAVARGGEAGGVMSPGTLSANMRFAASQGMLAYNNLFTQNGRLDSNQLHGLDLKTAGGVIGRVLSERSTYDRWASEAKADSNSGLSTTEIDNLSNGIGVSKKAQESLNKSIKKFTGEINELVASVSKITGSYEEAVSFLQKATGGSLFKNTADADKLRDQARKLATGMRVAARDAGMDPRVLYGMQSQFGASAAAAAGIGSVGMMFGGGDPFTMMSGIAAIGAAKAIGGGGLTEEEQERAKAAASAIASGHAASPQAKTNAIMAAYMDMGWVQKGSDTHKQYMRAIKSGDARLAMKIAQDAMGEEQFMKFYNNEADLALFRKNSQATYGELSSMSMADQSKKEVFTVGKQVSFEKLMDMGFSMASGGDSRKAAALKSDYRKMQKDAMLTDDVLNKSGFTGNREELRKKAERMSVWDIQSEITKGGGNATYVSAMSRKAAADSFRKFINESKMPEDQKAAILKGFDKKAEDIDKSFSEKDIEDAKADVALKRKREEFDELKLSAMDNDANALGSITDTSSNDSIVSKALRGEEGYSFSGKDYEEQFMHDVAKAGVEGFSEFGDVEQKKKIAVLQEKYNEAKNSGKSEAEAREAVIGELSEGKRESVRKNMNSIAASAAKHVVDARVANRILERVDGILTKGATKDVSIESMKLTDDKKKELLNMYVSSKKSGKDRASAMYNALRDAYKSSVDKADVKTGAYVGKFFDAQKDVGGFLDDISKEILMEEVASYGEGIKIDRGAVTEKDKAEIGYAEAYEQADENSLKKDGLRASSIAGDSASRGGNADAALAQSEKGRVWGHMSDALHDTESKTTQKAVRIADAQDAARATRQADFGTAPNISAVAGKYKITKNRGKDLERLANAAKEAWGDQYDTKLEYYREHTDEFMTDMSNVFGKFKDEKVREAWGTLTKGGKHSLGISASGLLEGIAATKEAGVGAGMKELVLDKMNSEKKDDTMNETVRILTNIHDLLVRRSV